MRNPKGSKTSRRASSGHFEKKPLTAIKFDQISANPKSQTQSSPAYQPENQ
jgi:hypothetical protein